MQTILKQLKIKADVVNIEQNESMTKYYLRMHPGAKVSKVENCSTEIALGLKAFSKPIIKVITEQGLVSLEMLTKPVNTVNFSEIISTETEYSLPLFLGRSHDGRELITDLTKMPHLLIAGTTGSGKSVLLHSIISGLLKSAANVRLALIDPKKVEFSYYSEVKQLLYPVVTDPDAALGVLSDLVVEMEARFKELSKNKVNNIDDYNEKKGNTMPYIVLVIDEFSDLMHVSKKEFQKKLCMLAQKSRACGIHIIIATQRPSVDVVTGLIKANFPARISCMVSSLTDSRVILGASGAEKLLGKGDSLISAVGYNMTRFQGAYISPEQIDTICLENQRSRMARVLNFFKGM